jgi:hypothetical protein
LLSGGREMSAVTDLHDEVIEDAVRAQPDPKTVIWRLAGGLAVALLAVIGLGAWVYDDHQRMTATPTTTTLTDA